MKAAVKIEDRQEAKRKSITLLKRDSIDKYSEKGTGREQESDRKKGTDKINKGNHTMLQPELNIHCSENHEIKKRKTGIHKTTEQTETPLNSIFPFLQHQKNQGFPTLKNDLSLNFFAEGAATCGTAILIPAWSTTEIPIFDNFFALLPGGNLGACEGAVETRQSASPNLSSTYAMPSKEVILLMPALCSAPRSLTGVCDLVMRTGG